MKLQDLTEDQKAQFDLLGAAMLNGNVAVVSSYLDDQPVGVVVAIVDDPESDGALQRLAPLAIVLDGPLFERIADPSEEIADRFLEHELQKILAEG